MGTPSSLIVGIQSRVWDDAMTACNFGVFCLIHLAAYEHFIAIFTFNTTHITRSLFILAASLCRDGVRIKFGVLIIILDKNVLT
jgi:hypothetical protein